jgi:hypothetical protein
LMSSEIATISAPTVSKQPEGNMGHAQTRACHRHCGVADPTHVGKLHAREPRDPVAIRGPVLADRWVKAMSDKTHMNGGRESHSGIVPTKRSNESQGGPKEIVEGRPLTGENVSPPIPHRTPSRTSGQTMVD